MSTIFIGKTCSTCSKPIPPVEANGLGDDLQGYVCIDCRLQQAAALRSLSESMSNGEANDLGQTCAECHKGLEEIEALTGRRSLFYDFKDGVMRCKGCTDSMEAKRLTSSTLRGRYKHMDRQEFNRFLFMNYWKLLRESRKVVKVNAK